MTILQRILLNDACFTQCVHQYIANEKPDPIQTKQLESWKMTWINDDNDDDDDLNNSKNDNNNKNNNIITDSASTDVSTSLPNDESDDVGVIPMNFTPSHILSGRLQIVSKECFSMILTLYTKCVWVGDLMNGSIRFTCHVSVARPHITTTAVSGDDTDATTTTNTITKKKKMKQKESTRNTTAMIDRLCRDEHIRKILVPTNKTNTEDGIIDTNQKQDKYLLCSASMDTTTTKNESDTTTTTDNNNNCPWNNKNEERVYCDEMIGEAIRRTIYSSSDSILDIVDLLFQFPYLPCTTTNGTTTATTATTTTTKLADRVRLRLLEEATYDVCNNEPDDEIVDELSIQDIPHHDDDNENDTSQKDNAVISRKNKKMKR